MLILMPNIPCLNSISVFEIIDWFDCNKNDIGYQKLMDLINDIIQNVLDTQKPKWMRVMNWRIMIKESTKYK